jgi:hydroxyacylglutathione hydrolase
VFFRQILHSDLGCASYVLADQGEAAVVDPKWEIGEYLSVAEQAGAAILHVLETHHHADHVSGRRRLAAATGARLHVPADPDRPDRDALRDGDRLYVGRVEIRALASPGHRPEHLSYLVTDGARAAGEPCLLLSGDSLLVGDVARPDLAVAREDGARALWRSLLEFEALGDHVELWPAHVGGSLCGSRSLSAKTSSTIGYERLANPLFCAGDETAFVAELTRSIPPRPPSVDRVVALNRNGAEPVSTPELGQAELVGAFAGGACILDARPPDVFDAGHIAGALNLDAAGRNLGTRAGWAAGVEVPIIVVSTTIESANDVASRLYAAGLWNIAGVTAADPAGWSAAGLEVRTAAAVSAESAAPRLRTGEMRLLDVRDRDEWQTGHIAGSWHLPLSELGDGRTFALADGPLTEDGRLAVACASGGRAALAASVLRRRGHGNVMRVRGGVADLARHGAPFVHA